MPEGFWLAEDLIIELQEDTMPAVVVPGKRCRICLGPEALLFLFEVACLNLSGKSLPAEQAAQSHSDLVSKLLEYGVIGERTSNSRAYRSNTLLSLLEWATLKMSQVGGILPPPNVPNSGMDNSVHMRDGAQPVALPEPETPRGVGFWDTIIARRSVRTGAGKSVPLSSVALLLSHSVRAGTVARDEFGQISYRRVASAGARHPTDIFVAAVRVADLAEGVYRYDPFRHELIPIEDGCHNAAELSRMAATALGETCYVLPALSMFFVAVPVRTACKYHDMALMLIMKDIGCITQQIYLLVQALGLAGCAVGGADPTIEEGLRLQASRELLMGGFVIW
jgi:SagB-type dehydrogenase family enzyme